MPMLLFVSDSVASLKGSSLLAEKKKIFLKATMESTANVLTLPKFGKELKQCGFHWGKNVELSGAGPIKAYVGKKSWMETAVNGDIGLHGNEPGNGPGIIIQDVENAGIDLLWTAGLIGCIALAISSI